MFNSSKHIIFHKYLQKHAIQSQYVLLFIVCITVNYQINRLVFLVLEVNLFSFVHDPQQGFHLSYKKITQIKVSHNHGNLQQIEHARKRQTAII